MMGGDFGPIDDSIQGMIECTAGMELESKMTLGLAV